MSFSARKINRLKGFLAVYGDHRSSCAITHRLHRNPQTDEPYPACSCGWDQLLHGELEGLDGFAKYTEGWEYKTHPPVKTKRG